MPQLKAGARNEIFIQPDQELENMEGWHHLLDELHQMSRRGEKDSREGYQENCRNTPIDDRRA